jgi:hypothetical protein
MKTKVIITDIHESDAYAEDLPVLKGKKFILERKVTVHNGDMEGYIGGYFQSISKLPYISGRDNDPEGYFVFYAVKYTEYGKN